MVRSIAFANTDLTSSDNASSSIISCSSGRDCELGFRRLDIIIHNEGLGEEILCEIKIFLK